MCVCHCVWTTVGLAIEPKKLRIIDCQPPDGPCVIFGNRTVPMH